MMASGGANVESHAWQNSKSIGRACGSAFVRAIMQALDSQGDAPLPPTADKAAVARTYNELCCTVLEVLRGSTVFEGEDQTTRHTESLPLDDSDNGKCHNPRLKLAVKNFLSITPESTYMYGGPHIKGFLNECARRGDPLENNPEDDPVEPYQLENAWHIMRFRTDFAALLTHIVDHLRLPRPMNKAALEFDYMLWCNRRRGDKPMCDSAFFGPDWQAFRKIAEPIVYELNAYGTVVQGGSFPAMPKYVTASLFEYYRATESMAAAEAKWAEFLNEINQMSNHLVDIARSNARLRVLSDRHKKAVGNA